MGRPGAGPGGGGGSRPRPPIGGQNRAGTHRPMGGSRPNTPRPTGGRPGGNLRPPSGRPVGRPGGAPPRTPPRSGLGSVQRNRRYAPSPKRPGSYRRNNGCTNVVIGGVVFGIVVLIIVLNILRSSCAGCVNNASSDIDSSSGISSVSGSGNSGSVPDNSSGTSGGNSTSSTESAQNSSEPHVSSTVTNPPEPVPPILTLRKNVPEKEFTANCIVDELKWFDNVKSAGESLKFVYEKLGIQPYVVFKKYDADLKTDEDKIKYCVDWYKEHIDDEDTFLLMYFAEKESDVSVGYTVYYSGANAEKLAVSFRDFLEEGINEYWFTDLSTDDVIKYAFQYTCYRIKIE